MTLAANPATHPGAKQQDGRESQPAAHGMHHNAASKVVERGTESPFKPGLQAGAVLTPDQRFKERVGEPRKDSSGKNLGPETCPLGYATGDDCRDAGCETEQKEEADQFVTLVGAEQALCCHEEMNTVGDRVADQEVDDGGDRPVSKDLHQSIGLTFLPDSTDFEKRKASMHGKNHD